MRCSGRLVQWNEARGFGLVQIDGSGERVFVHISAWQPRPDAQQRPQVGMPLTLALGMVQGKPRALAVAWREPHRRAPVQGRARAAGATAVPGQVRRSQGARTPAHHRGASMPLLVFFLWWAAVAAVWSVSEWVVWAYAGLSLWCFGTYWHDKHQAQSGGWRTPEATLHALALLGGWPGALLAQQWLRHKSSKPEFRHAFWATVVLNMLAFTGLHAPAVQAWLLHR